MFIEKRSSLRVQYRKIVQLSNVHYTKGGQLEPSNDSPIQLEAINISPDGICLKTDRFFIPNRIFQLDFEYMDKPVHATAQVVWSEQTACGLQFVRPAEVVSLFQEKAEKMTESRT